MGGCSVLSSGSGWRSHDPQVRGDGGIAFPLGLVCGSLVSPGLVGVFWVSRWGIGRGYLVSPGVNGWLSRVSSGSRLNRRMVKTILFKLYLRSPKIKIPISAVLTVASDHDKLYKLQNLSCTFRLGTYSDYNT